MLRCRCVNILEAEHQRRVRVESSMNRGLPRAYFVMSQCVLHPHAPPSLLAPLMRFAFLRVHSITAEAVEESFIRVDLEWPCVDSELAYFRQILADDNQLSSRSA